METETIRRAVRKRKYPLYNKEENDMQIFSKIYGDRETERTVFIDILQLVNEEKVNKLICCREITELIS